MFDLANLLIKSLHEPTIWYYKKRLEFDKVTNCLSLPRIDRMQDFRAKMESPGEKTPIDLYQIDLGLKPGISTS